MFFLRCVILVIAFFSCANFSLFAQQASITPEPIVETAEALPDTLGKLVSVETIIIRGYKKTKEYIIEREIPFRKGDQLYKSDLNKKVQLAKQQLMNTSLFVDVEVTPRLIDTLAFIDVYVKERWYLFPLPYFKIVGRNFNDWWVTHKRSLQRVNYGVKFMQNNVSGRNDNLNIWLYSGYSQQASLRYENPFVDKTLKHGISISVAYNRNREVNYADSINKQVFIKNPDEFLSRSFYFDLGYTYRPKIKTRHSFRLQYADIEVNNQVLELNPNYHPEGKKRIKFPGASYSIQYFDVDYIPYPTKGFMGDAHIYSRFSKDHMTQLGAKGTYTKEVLNKLYLQFQMAGLIKAPFDQAFYSRGMFGSSDFYMRGLEDYVIQGVAGGFGRATAIKQALAFSVRNPINTKTHDKIPFRIMLKAYGDLGYSYLPNPNTSLLNNKLLRTWGAGIDVVTIYDMVLKLEYSFNQLGEKGLFIHTATDF